MGILMIIIGIIMFMSLVIIHELGHFRAAKKTGVKVKEFWIGIPPKIWRLRKDKSGTEYTLNRIPLGGFCSLEGDDPSHPETFRAKDSFITAKLRRKLLIILGGIIMNLIAARVIFTALFWIGINPLAPNDKFESKSYLMPNVSFLIDEGFAEGEIRSGVVIREVAPDSLAESLPLQVEDIILSLNEIEVEYGNLSELLSNRGNQYTTIAIERSWEKLEYGFTCEEECKLGITFIPNATVEIHKIKFWLLGAMKAALHEIKAEFSLTCTALGIVGKGLFSFNAEKAKDAINMLAGPVGAVKMGEILYSSWGRLAYLAFAGMISLALAFFNLLPIPALDGGRGIGVIIQATFKIKPEKYFQYEGYVNAFFFYLLILLGIVIIFKDLIFFWGMKLPFIG